MSAHLLKQEEANDKNHTAAVAGTKEDVLDAQLFGLVKLDLCFDLVVLAAIELFPFEACLGSVVILHA